MSSASEDRIAVRLRALTAARVGLGRTGVSQTACDVLAFQQAHAMARDAVHAVLHTGTVAAEMETAYAACEVLRLHSAAADRAAYLQRPDLGCMLDQESRAVVVGKTVGCNIALVIADGLSALAVEHHAVSVLKALLPRLAGWTLAPIAIVEQGRVAIGDEIGEAFGAEIAVVLIGERPGLSSPDSLGAYITGMPRRGRSHAERVCVSNIRPEGLGYDEAAAQLEQILTNARRLRMTGVGMQPALKGPGEESKA